MSTKLSVQIKQGWSLKPLAFESYHLEVHLCELEKARPIVEPYGTTALTRNYF